MMVISLNAKTVIIKSIAPYVLFEMSMKANILIVRMSIHISVPLLRLSDK